MTDFLIFITESIFGESIFFIPMMVVCLGAYLLHWLYKQYRLPRYVCISGILILAGIGMLLCAGSLLWTANKGEMRAWAQFMTMPKSAFEGLQLANLLLGIGTMLICFPMLYTVITYFRINCRLNSVLRYTKTDSFDYDPIEAWRRIDRLASSKLMPWQQRRYQKYRLHLRMLLGNFSGAEPEIAMLESVEPAYDHLLRFMQAQTCGEIAQAAEHIQKAEESCDADTDPMVRGEILCNRGVAYVMLGLYQDADDYFIKTIKYFEENKVKQKELWIALYYNYAFNRTRLKADPVEETWQERLEGLKQYLDMERPIDYVEYFNIKMEMLRQTHADKKEIDEVIYYGMDYLTNHCDIPAGNRCMIEVSIARMVWAARLDPHCILEAIKRNWTDFQTLRMPTRYFAMKEFDTLFRDLHGTILEGCTDMIEEAHWYMINQAPIDLTNYRKTLPAEAVLQRCTCFLELAGLKQRRPDTYSYKDVSALFGNAASLYSENGMLMQLMDCKLALLDEATHPFNMDEDLLPLQIAEMRSLIAEAEAFLPRLKKHPKLSEVTLRLGFYCAVAGEYERCKRLYRQYKESAETYALEHFAPWMHAYYLKLSFMVRILYIEETIERLRESKELSAKSEAVQKWFREVYGRHGGFTSFVIGRLLGMETNIPLKMKLWPVDDMKLGSDDVGNGAKRQWAYDIVENRDVLPEEIQKYVTGAVAEHIWLCFPPLMTEIDLTYHKYIEDVHCETLFFAANHHPMETERSLFIQKLHLKEDSPCRQTYMQYACLEQFVPMTQAAILELEAMISAALPAYCPDVEELKSVYQYTMMPVPVN